MRTATRCLRRRRAGRRDDDSNADKAADGIGVVDVATRSLKAKLSAGSDPEEFDLSGDGRHIYISNEDTKTASVITIGTEQARASSFLWARSRRASLRLLDGKRFYVTCEAGGDIYVIETAGFTVAAHFKVNGRPRSVAFSVERRHRVHSIRIRRRAQHHRHRECQGAEHHHAARRVAADAGQTFHR